MLESACETFFFKDDLRDIERKGYGVVFSCNASNHYCPTIVISKQNYASWQLEQLSLLAKAQLALIDEIEFNDVSDTNAVHLEVFKEQLNHTVQLFGPTLKTGAGTARAKAKRPHGILFTNVPGIPSDPQAPQNSVGEPNPTPPVPGAPAFHSPPAKGKKRKKYLC